MSKQRLSLLVLLIVVGLALPSVAMAQSDQEPVVRAVLFYSPTCPHCHKVITQVLLPMVEEYGDRLQIVGIDISQSAGAQLYRVAVEHYQIPDDRRGVPTLIIGDTVMVGGYEIPNQFPGLVKEGLASGGIDWPGIPGLDVLIAKADQESMPESTRSVTQDPDSAATAQPDAEEGDCRADEGVCQDPTSSAGAQSDIPEVVGPQLPATVEARLTDDGVVRLVFIWAEDCPHCHEVMEDVLPPLQTKYGGQLEIASIETSDPGRYRVYLAAIELFNLSPQRQGWPAVFVGDTHLLGSVEIPNELDGLIQLYLDQGGVDYPPIPGLDTVAAQAGSAASAETTEPQANPIYLAYFYQTGCQDCDQVKGDLNYLESKFLQLVVEEFNMRDNVALSEWLSARGCPRRSPTDCPHRLCRRRLFARRGLGRSLVASAVRHIYPWGRRAGLGELGRRGR